MPRFRITVSRMMILVAMLALVFGLLAFSHRPSSYGLKLAQEYHRRGVKAAGLASLANGRFVEAIDNYDQAIRLDPGFAEAYEDRGRAWQSLGQPKRAKADLKMAEQLASRPGN